LRAVQPQGGIEGAREPVFLQQGVACAFGQHLALAQQDHVFDLGDDFFQMMGDQNQRNALAGEFAQGVEQMFAGDRVKPCGRFIQQQRLRTMHQGTCDQDPPRFAGGQAVVGASVQVAGLGPRQCFGGLGAHGRRDMVVFQPDQPRLECAQHHILGLKLRQAHQVLVERTGDNPKPRAQGAYIPQVFPQDPHRRAAIGMRQRVQLPGDELDKGRFAAAIGPQYRGMPPGGQAQGDIVEGELLTTADAGVVEFDQGGGCGGHMDCCANAGRSIILTEFNREHAMWQRWIRVMMLATVLASCGQKAPLTTPVTGGWADLTAPASVVEWSLPTLRPGTHAPNLAATHDGRLLLSWVNSQRGRRHVFQFSSYDLAYQRWRGEPVTVVVGNSLVTQHNRPQMVASHDGALWAQWVQQTGPGRHDVMVSRSGDGGANWSAPQMPYVERAYSEQKQALLWPEAQGIGVAWMDGNVQGEVSLRAARFGADGRRGAEQVLDAEATDCQRPDAALTARGPRLVYGASLVEPGTRDEIRVVGGDGQGWTAPELLHRDDAAYSDCPVVAGPVMGAHADTVVIAWFSNDHPMVIRMAVSTDAGATFSAPVELYRGEDAGDPQAVMVDAQQVWVVWEKMRGEDEYSLWLSRYSLDLQREYERLEITNAAQGDVPTLGAPQLALAQGTGYLVWAVKRRDDASSLHGVKIQAGQGYLSQ